MAIKTLKIENLSAFEDATFELVPGINVLLGHDPLKRGVCARLVRDERDGP